MMNNYVVVSVLIVITSILALWYIYTNKNLCSCRISNNEYLDTKLTSGFSKIIFQTWKSKTDIPDNMKKWSDTWKDLNPHYKYVLFDDDDNRNFIKTYYPWFLEKYNSYDREINRADAVRYFYLYRNGGIYVDMDFECLKPMDHLLSQYQEYDVILGKMSDHEHGNNIPNAIMISKPGADFWIYVFYNLLYTEKSNSVEATTGPILLKKSIEMFNDQYSDDKMKDIQNILNNENKSSMIKILPPKYFYPIDWSISEGQTKRLSVIDENKVLDTDNEFPDSYAVTYWTHTW